MGFGGRILLTSGPWQQLPTRAAWSSAGSLANTVRPGRAVQRVNVDFPVDLLREIDQEARRLGVTRQAFIKVRLADALAKAASTN